MYLFYRDNQGEELFRYRLTHRTNQKKIVLSIKNNMINISCPLNSNIETINNFITLNLYDINQLIKKYKNNRLLCIEENEKFIYILGIKYDLVIVNQNIFTKIIGNQLFMKEKSNYIDQCKLIYAFLKKKYNQYFIETLSKWIAITGNEVNELKIKIMNNKWGICYNLYKRIILNIKLIHFEKRIIDYVIVHELVHLNFPYHNNDFWNRVEYFIPDYKQCNQILKDFFI